MAIYAWTADQQNSYRILLRKTYSDLVEPRLLNYIMRHRIRYSRYSKNYFQSKVFYKKNNIYDL